MLSQLPRGDEVDDSTAAGAKGEDEGEDVGNADGCFASVKEDDARQIVLCLQQVHRLFASPHGRHAVSGSRASRLVARSFLICFDLPLPSNDVVTFGHLFRTVFAFRRTSLYYAYMSSRLRVCLSPLILVSNSSSGNVGVVVRQQQCLWEIIVAALLLLLL